MITFRKIKLRNFMSYGNVDTEIVLDAPKSTLVVGENGAGKSVAFTDAMTFALFGKPYRKINKNQMVNSINGKDALVELEFSSAGHEYRVVRGIKPNIFKIFRDGVLLDQDSSVGAYQTMFEETILGMTYRTFSQVVILGVTQYTPFMELNTPQRREFIEDLLDMRIFGVMNNLHRNRVKALSEEIREQENLLAQAEIRLNGIEEKERALNEAAIDRTASIQEEISEKKTLLRIIKKRIEESQTRLAKARAEFSAGRMETLQERMRDYRSKMAVLASRAPKLEKEAAFFRENERCPVCSQEISEDFREWKVNEKMNKAREIEAYRAKLQSAIEKIAAEIDTLREAEQEAQRIETEMYGAKAEAKLLLGVIKELEAYEPPKVTNDVDEAEKAELKERIHVINERLGVLGDKLKVAQRATPLLKDDGIKAKMIARYVPTINAMVSKYLDAFDLFVSFTLDENFEESIKARHYDEYSYQSFSQGEKARINIALMLTWRNIARMRNSLDTNLLILDEVFDGSMNAAGVEAFKRILGDESVNYIVISHKKEAHESHFDRVIGVSKRQNFTVLEEAE